MEARLRANFVGLQSEGLESLELALAGAYAISVAAFQALTLNYLGHKWFHSANSGASRVLIEQPELSRTYIVCFTGRGGSRPLKHVERASLLVVVASL